jgi:hypothetical protein
MELDPFFDVKLAKLLPGRREDVHHLPAGLVLRIIDILEVISPGSRLLMMVGHLTRHPNEKIASKAALLIGPRIQSCEWIERHLSSRDPRLRANVVETLWGVRTPFALRILRKCSGDENNRVVGNALVGMWMLGERTVPRFVQRLMYDRRPEFRQTGAWVIGMVRDPEMVPLLETALTDPHQGVRQTAMNAIAKFQKARPEETLLRAPAAVEPAHQNTAPSEPAKPTPAEEEPTPKAPEYGLDLRLDGHFVTTR